MNQTTVSIKLHKKNNWTYATSRPFARIVHGAIVNNQKGYLAVQHVPLFLRSLLTRIMAEQPVQRSYWPQNAIDWPELA